MFSNGWMLNAEDYQIYRVADRNKKNHKTTTTTKIGENKPKTETHKTKRKPKTEKHYQKTETQIPIRK